MKALCPAHTQAKNAWLECVHELAAHPSMRPLDDKKHQAATAGKNAVTVLQKQVGIIRQQCALGYGCDQ